MNQDNVMRHPHWQHQTLVDWFKFIGVEDLQKYADRILKKIYTKVVVVGFFEEENALRIADTIDMTLHPVALPDHLKLAEHVSKLEPGYYILHKTVKDQDCQNIEAGLTNRPIEDIHNIVSNSVEADTTDTILNKVKELYKDADSSAQEAFNKSLDEYIHIRTAIEMALDHKRNPISYVVKNSNDFTGIGMIKTPEKQWIITNIDKFKATQSLVGKPAPVHNMIPKY
ncbi:hypothetical protein GGI07_001627 [Coemansia sp. Benny D115]|nr:hypothetical protein GGI07_001627 [Coemansia sp. Benny D115]